MENLDGITQVFAERTNKLSKLMIRCLEMVLVLLGGITIAQSISAVWLGLGHFVPGFEPKQYLLASFGLIVIIIGDYP